MLQIQFLRENVDLVKKRLEKRNLRELEVVDEVIDLDLKRRETQQKVYKIQSEINSSSKEIGKLYAQGKKEDADSLKTGVSKDKDALKVLEEKLKNFDNELHELLIKLPNLPHPNVPDGTSHEDNVVVREGGVIPELSVANKPHWELADQFKIIDFELGTKISGSGFPVFLGKGAKLQRGLIQYFIDQAIKEGYQEIIPPLIVNEDTAYGTGQLPDKEGQMYHIGTDNLYLIPTAEVPLTNIYRNKLLKVDELPVKLVGSTSCFRREAGSYGKEVRGLNRIHQFDKVEIVQLVEQEVSYYVLEKMVDYVESLVKSLGLPYRIVKLCGGDMGFTSSLTYDFEVYSAGQGLWLEVSSVSNFETFQSNRMQIRYRDLEKKNKLVHSLNGSALALPRIMAALLENNQTEDGIWIPDVLRPYTGFDIID